MMNNQSSNMGAKLPYNKTFPGSAHYEQDTHHTGRFTVTIGGS